METLQKALAWKHTQKIITFVIILNAVVLGIFPGVHSSYFHYFA
ncbi:hypothetical protein [Anaerovibrio sp.]